MPRWMQQDLFDAIVVAHLMTEAAQSTNAESELHGLAAAYVRDYDGEDEARIVRDVAAAADPARDNR